MNQYLFRPSVIIFLLLLSLFLYGCHGKSGPGNNKSTFAKLAVNSWTSPSKWKLAHSKQSNIKLTGESKLPGESIKIDFRLAENGWVSLQKKISKLEAETRPLVLWLETKVTSKLEVKLIDSDGSVFGKKVPLTDEYKTGKRLILYRKNTTYWWGGEDDNFDELSAVEIAFSGQGEGTVYLADIGFGLPDLKATFPPAGPKLDPNRKAPGVGFKQRRAKSMQAEDTLVLTWLKRVQDVSSPARALLPSMEGNQAHTFNNALVSMAFMLKGERGRAERILDFFAGATAHKNPCPAYQNFFYRGEPRGFFQQVTLRREGKLPAYHNPGKSDRWMGDMAWLLMAYRYYEKKYNSDKYTEISRLMLNLLEEWFTKAEAGGYVQHGWRKGDSYLHEESGHPEGNIDCYAAFRLWGREELAQKIRTWLDETVHGKGLPLDLYTWRVLAYGKKHANLLNIPEYDLRYRKKMQINGQQVLGFYPFPTPKTKNIWLDGVGHMACAYLATDRLQRGYFYANQMDAFIKTEKIRGQQVHYLPYTAKATGDYSWVKTNKGAASAAAWYIFAKNGFNPLKLNRLKNIDT